MEIIQKSRERQSMKYFNGRAFAVKLCTSEPALMYHRIIFYVCSGSKIVEEEEIEAGYYYYFGFVDGWGNNNNFVTKLNKISDHKMASTVETPSSSHFIIIHSLTLNFYYIIFICGFC